MKIESMRARPYRGFKVDDADLPAEVRERLSAIRQYDELRAAGCAEQAALKVIGVSRRAYPLARHRDRRRAPRQHLRRPGQAQAPPQVRVANRSGCGRGLDSRPRALRPASPGRERWPVCGRLSSCATRHRHRQGRPIPKCHDWVLYRFPYYGAGSVDIRVPLAGAKNAIAQVVGACAFKPKRKRRSRRS